MRCGLFHRKCHPLLDHPVLTGVGLGLLAVGAVAVVSVVRREAPLWGSKMKAAEAKCQKACGDLWNTLQKEAESVVGGMADAISSHMPSGAEGESGAAGATGAEDTAQGANA